MSDDLVRRLPARLAEAKTADEADLLRREVEAFIAVAKKAPAGQIELQWPALLRLRLDAWRRWGEMLGEAERDKPPPGGVTDGHAMDEAERKRRHRARKLAFDVPDDAYFKYRACEDVDKLTLAGALRLVPAPEHDDPPPPEGKYRTIVLDPPWPIKRIERSEQRPDQPHALDYPVMSLDEIQALPISELADDDGCHVYLWVTHRFLPAGLELLRDWGVNYECVMTWRKNVGITPFSWMYDTEHVLFGRIGSLAVQRKGLRLSFSADVDGHSVKPDVFYERVAEASPEPRYEMFARRERPGFVTWGNEVARAA